jgi:magnesium chelatase subunit D
VIFPFTAIVGQDLLKKALLINAIDPTVSGVLIKGDKGTGKSTAVRALADLLPKLKVVKACPFNCHPNNLRLMCKSCQLRVESGEAEELSWNEKKMEIVDMPLSATEDMVVGTIDIKRALKEGMKALEPGILARANRNILYIDEVNLLDDHLVNVLLDAAAMGVNIVEREGISLHHPARFILVGTMNPEEGDLRPQILDRFGLCVEVKALTSKVERLDVMRYRKEFDDDPWKFEEKFKDAQEVLGKKIFDAQQILPDVAIPDDLMEKIVDITTSLGIKTHRADIILEKTSRALAALDGRKIVSEEDLKQAALMALSHRIRQQPFEKSVSLTQETIESIMKPRDEEQLEEDTEFEKNARIKRDVLKFDPGNTSNGKDTPRVEGDRGLYIKARNNNKPKSVAVDATIKRAIRETGKLEVLPEHLMEKVRISKGAALYIILLDASSSMRMEKKIRFAKTLAWLLLKRSYEKKNRISLVTFRGEDTRVIVPPTSAVARIGDALEGLQTGGKTPLTPALHKAIQMAKKETKAKPSIILISDGKGNVYFKNSLEDDIDALSGMVGNGTNLVMINAENKKRSLGLLEEMSSKLNATHFYLEDVI